MIEDAIKQLEGILNSYKETVNITINYTGATTISYKNKVVESSNKHVYFTNSIEMLEWLEENLNKV